MRTRTRGRKRRGNEKVDNGVGMYKRKRGGKKCENMRSEHQRREARPGE